MKFLTVTDSGMEEILWNSEKPVVEGAVKKYQRRTNQATLSGAQCTVRSAPAFMCLIQQCSVHLYVLYGQIHGEFNALNLQSSWF